MTEDTDESVTVHRLLVLQKEGWEVAERP